jgi:flagellar M-ring protein FliF
MFELSKPQVNGIVHLVSRSVEGLKPEDVVIIDLYGRLLSGDVLSSGVGSEFHHGTNLELQHAFQTELERSLQSLLERVLGPGNVVTKVTAELNFDQKTVDTILFQPHDTGITRSIQELEETFKGSGTTPSGVPGVTSNIPQYQAQTVTGESEWNRSESVRNYEISEIKERTVVAPGSVKRLSVAVVVNRELDEDARQAIVNTVSAAIGYDADRNDIVTITGIAFDTSLIDAIKKQMEHEASPVDDSPARSTLIRNIALGGGGALLLLLFFVVFRRRPARAPSARPRVDVEAALAAAAELAAAEESREPDPAQEKRKRTRGEIEQAARQNPENVARLIKTWLQEDRR